MAYFAPYIDETGLHIPTYTDIRDLLISEAKRIFGQDVYLGNDSQDYEYISSVANVTYDALQAVQQVYNNRSPGSAIGEAMDGLILINGIRRKNAAYSKSAVLISGTANTVINNGVVKDTGGNRWNLPTSVTIPASQSIKVYALAQEPGPVVPDQISSIETPTYGWEKVESANDPAYPTEIGVNAESDAELKARQKISTARPSKTVFEGTVGGIAEIAGVTRVRGYENDTNLVDANTLPGHSIAIVVEGGNNAAIAEEIYLRKTPGCYTYGTTEVTIQDIYGESTTIRFFRPTYVDTNVIVTLKRLDSYTNAIEEDVKVRLVDYINSIGIGNDLPISALWGAAMAANPDLRTPAFSITQILAGPSGSESANDQVILFNQACRSDLTRITIVYA